MMAFDAPPVVHQYGCWMPMSVKVPIFRHFQGYLEIQPTFQKEHKPVFTENQIRPALAYQFNSRWSAMAGWFWSPHFERKGPTDNETMLWQQVTYSRKFERITLQNRFRPEEVRKDSYRGTEVRIRNQIRMSIDLGASPYYIAISDEPFYNLNSCPKGPMSGFAENRLFIGVGKKINRFTRFEIGYMNQYKNSRTNAADKSNHVLLANLSLDFTNWKTKPQYKLASSPPAPIQVACAPQIVLPDFYSHSSIMFAENTANRAYHPALAGLTRTHSL